MLFNPLGYAAVLLVTLSCGCCLSTSTRMEVYSALTVGTQLLFSLGNFQGDPGDTNYLRLNSLQCLTWQLITKYAHSGACKCAFLKAHKRAHQVKACSVTLKPELNHWNP